MSNFYVGQRFSNFIVESISGERAKNGTMRKYLHLICDCGKKKIARSYSITSRKVNKCVCDNEGKYAKTHGMYGTKIHTVYRSMIQRCYDKNTSSYSIYGGRGIKVCEDWLLSFDRFYKDMGDVKKGMSLDRIDPNIGYSKENCRWASYSDQAHNKRALTDGFKGVTKANNKYTSRILYKGKRIHIGIYPNPLDAALAYDKAAIELRKENSMTNKQLGKYKKAEMEKVFAFYKFSKPEDLYMDSIMRGAE